MRKLAEISKFLLILLLVTGWLFSGFPKIWQNPRITPEIQKVQAAAYTVTDTYWAFTTNL